MNESLYFKNGKPRKHPKKIKAVIVDEPVPIVNIEEKQIIKGEHNTYNTEGRKKPIVRENAGKYDPPLPVSVVNIDETITSNSKDESTCEIYNADCITKMKDIPDNSIDLIFCDLPYGQTSCKWDSLIDLELFWIEVMRIKKLRTPIFMTTTTKFGVSLIQSAPKKCFFRYDIVWVKSAPAGFLCAKKMPMRKHEMIYVFYEKLPFYDLSSHTHKFIKETEPSKTRKVYGKGDGKNCGSMFDKDGKSYFKSGKETQTKYDPPLPVSVVKEDCYDKDKTNDSLRAGHRNKKYSPPLPTSMLEVKSTRGKHSTEKPVALMEWIFKYYSKPGDVILDPTMGSGSTGVACKNMNRNFIGIEMDKEIYEGAKSRLEL